MTDNLNYITTVFERREPSNFYYYFGFVGINN